MIEEFKEFISKGNLVEIAVGLILALASPVGGLVHREPDRPIVGAIWAAELRQSRDRHRRGPAAVRSVPHHALLNFVIVAFVLFLVVKAYNRMAAKEEAAAGPTEIELLTEIRDELGSAESRPGVELWPRVPIQDMRIDATSDAMKLIKARGGMLFVWMEAGCRASDSSRTSTEPPPDALDWDRMETPRLPHHAAKMRKPRTPASRCGDS